MGLTPLQVGPAIVRHLLAKSCRILIPKDYIGLCALRDLALVHTCKY